MTTASIMNEMTEPMRNVFPEDCNSMYIMAYKLLRMMQNNAEALIPFMT